MAKKQQRTIAVDTATLERIARHGHFRDSYCSIINRLLDIVEKRDKELLNEILGEQKDEQEG